MNPVASSLLSVSVPTVVVLIGILFNHYESNKLSTQIRELRVDLTSRIDRISDDLGVFHRELGRHDKAIEILEKDR